jgi:hypothetical protein
MPSRPPPALPDDLHEWISFEDPDEDRTWVFDATFLLSPWTCIFGHGCQGVLTGPAAHLEQGCCSYGAHLIDDDDVAAVSVSVERLRDDHWQHRRKGLRRWLEVDGDGTRTTRVVDGACIFLNRPGFAGGIGCAFHVAALEAGERPLDWKPDVCWQLPLRLHEHSDDHGHVTSTLREWKRRDWGEGGQEFHWWCTESGDAFIGSSPVYRTLRDEIVEITGEQVYELLVGLLDARIATRSMPLPHPAVRKR